MSRVLTLLVMLLSLAACGSQEAAAPADLPMGKMAAEPAVALEASADAMAAAGVAGSAPLLGPTQPNLPPDTASPTLIAYSYAMNVELPAKQVIAARDAHVAACAAAGPARCQLLNSSSNVMGEEQVSASLQLRGTPAWLEAFRASVAADAQRLDGRVIGSSISSEDLTRQIVDTEATLRAQTQLRSRLSELLAKHQGKLADLLEVERELARVQAEIDARTSALNVMRTRIAMSDLSISYQSRGVLVSDRTADPTIAALLEFFDTVSYSFASVIRFVASILPWLLVLLPALWLIRWAWRRRT